MRNAILVFAGMLGAVFSFQQASAAASKGVIEIGCITPLSGAAAPIGDRLSAGAKFAISQRPTVNGWEVQLNLQDTVGDPANALQKAQALAGNDNVRAITCLGYSQEAAAISGALKTGRLEIPYIDGNNVGDNITGDFCNDWTFRVAPNISTMINAMKLYLERNPSVGQNGWYIIGSDSAYGHGMEKTFAKVGAKVVGSNLAALDTQDWLPVINKALSSGADAIWLPVNFGTSLSQFLNQASQLGLLKQTKVFLPVGLPFLDAIQTLGDDGIGLISTSYQTDFVLPEAHDIAKAYYEANGEPPSQQTLQQIAVTNIILDAIEATQEPTREAIREALATKEFKNFNGTVKFRQPDQQAINTLLEGSIHKLSEPQFGVNYSWVAERSYSSAEVMPSAEEMGCKK
ncbi:ABC transporter substrate-binding protein [Limibacillus sp. MBR-115]|jgi:ABC-type branched-subunit amino acid transport system substrate-binding protein|uniref:ABC transporter substrate-binding protein n=1 Tax=Limibacillus sp. MBR-115 TaxID=3156465 RepID=UPI003393868D